MTGSVTLFGSGETTHTGGRIFEDLARQITPPLHISVLETPAGFEANAGRVAERISEFLSGRLQNYQPHLHQLPARKKGTPYSPDSPEVVAPLYQSNMIFLGPGSPTYAVRQLENSLAWDIIQARHRLGASLVFASAATIASGDLALPVYEIFKVGEDPHWKPGLNFFAPFGLALVIIPHWNNQDGGAELDTSRCFIGEERFEQLLARLSPEKTVLGIDEQTAVTFDFQSRTCSIAGLGSVHLLRGGQQVDIPAGEDFPFSALGDYRPLAALETGLPDHVWRQAQQEAGRLMQNQEKVELPPELQRLIEARENARKQRDWARADTLREEIAAMGWKVVDTPEGPQVQPFE